METIEMHWKFGIAMVILLILLSLGLTGAVDFMLRVLLGAVGLAGVGVGVSARGEFRTGRGQVSQGERIEPQWTGRLFFGLGGALMLYVAITGFK